MPTSRITQPKEMVCLQCDGAGLESDDTKKFGVRVCRGCNGKGVILFDNRTGIIKYDMDNHAITKVVIQ